MWEELGRSPYSLEKLLIGYPLKDVPVNGIVVTKLDGTAKGGVVISIKEELGVPVRWIGVGEGMDDLRPFNAKEFANALFNKGMIQGDK